MIRNFLRKNWLYIVLVCFIVAVNVVPRLEEKEKAPDRVESVEKKPKEEETFFVDFEEAQKRSARVEKVLRGNPALYLLYLSTNILIILIFFSGLALGGYYLFNKFRKREILRKMLGIRPPDWKMSEIVKMLILALAVSYILFVGFGIFMGILQSLTQAEFSFYKNINFRMIFDTIILDLALFLVIIYFLREVHKSNFSAFGFVKKNTARNILYGAAGYVVIVPVILVMGIVIYAVLNVLKMKPPPQPIVQLFLAEKNVALVFISGVVAAIFGPVIEEIFFRGVMYNAVKKKIGIFWGVLITSVLFSFLHTHAMSYFLVGFIPITILGAMLAYLYEKTGSLIPSITMHILNNIGSVFMVFLFRYFSKLAG